MEKSYYTKQILRERVKQLSEALGVGLELINSNGKWAVQYEGGDGFGPLGWYRSVKYCIIYIEGVLHGIKLTKQ